MVDYSFLKWKDAKLAPYRDALVKAEKAHFGASRNVDALIRTEANWNVRSISIFAAEAADIEKAARAAKRQAQKALEKAEAFYSLKEYYNERSRKWTA